MATFTANTGGTSDIVVHNTCPDDNKSFNHSIKTFTLKRLFTFLCIVIATIVFISSSRVEAASIGNHDRRAAAAAAPAAPKGMQVWKAFFQPTDI